MKKRKLITIVVFSFIMTSIVPLVLLGAFVGVSVAREIQKDIIAQNSILSASIADKIAYFLDAAKNSLATVAFFLDMDPRGTSVPIEKLFEFTGYFSSVMLLDEGGTVQGVWPENSDVQGMDLSRKDFFTSIDTDHTHYWSPVFMSPDTGEPAISLSIKCVHGVVTAFIHLPKVLVFLPETKLRKNSSLYVLDAKGIVIASNRKELAAQRVNIADIPILGSSEQGSTRIFNWRGKQRLGSAWHIPDVNWHFIIEQPVADAFAVEYIVVSYFTAGFFTVLIFLVVSIRLLSVLLKPLQKMASFMNALEDNEYRLFSDHSPVYEFELLGNSFNAMCAAIDQRERNLKNLIEEKSILLKEVNHRVKNNLLMISSMFSLQSDLVDNSIVHDVLSDARSRIESIALVHSMLYREEKTASLPFREYMENLADAIQESFALVYIKKKFSIDEFYLSMDKAIPVGLILNEILTNVYKHAFPADGGIDLPCLEINAVNDRGQITVTIKDNGVGASRGNFGSEEGKMGMRLVHLLTMQLKGTIDIQHRGGTAVTLKFDKDM